MAVRQSILAGALVGTVAFMCLPTTIVSGVGVSEATAKESRRAKATAGKAASKAARSGGAAAKGQGRQRFSARAARKAAARVSVDAKSDETAAPIAVVPPPRPGLSTEVTASITSADGKAEGLRPALEAQARRLAAVAPDLSGPPLSASAAATPPTSAPTVARSVVFDFEKGVKTVVFGDGIIVSEKFDTAQMRELANLRLPER